jgi:hypothetical protein
MVCLLKRKNEVEISKIRKIESVTVFGVAMLIIGLSLLFLPLHAISAVPSNCTGLPTSGNVSLKSQHIGQSWDFFNNGGCNPSTIGSGNVLWHLVLSPVDKDATAVINGVVGENHGGSIHWTFINTSLTAPEWVAEVSNGLLYSGPNCNLQSELRISDTCYGGTGTTETTTVETTAAETTAVVETTAAVTTVVETTAAETTSAETTAVETTAVETTAIVETTAAETTAVETTAAETTAAETTSAETTSVETTAAAETTFAETTTVETISIETTVPETTGTQATVETAGIIQVLGIESLAYTGFNFLYLIFGVIAIIIGAIVIGVRKF